MIHLVDPNSSALWPFFLMADRGLKYWTCHPEWDLLVQKSIDNGPYNMLPRFIVSSNYNGDPGWHTS